MNHRRPMIAAMLCIIMALSLFASSACIVHETAHHHNCSGDHCPICQFIAQIEQLLRGFGTALLALLLLCFALTFGREWHTLAMTADVPALCTLVGRKIRLND